MTTTTMSKTRRYLPSASETPGELPGATKAMAGCPTLTSSDKWPAMSGPVSSSSSLDFKTKIEMSAQSEQPHADPAPANGAAQLKRKNTRSTLPSISTIFRTFLIAAVGALGGQVVTGLWPIIWAKIDPPPKDPYTYLIGRYKGQWDWIDPTTHAPTNTFDIVHIISITNGQLVGHGAD